MTYISLIVTFFKIPFRLRKHLTESKLARLLTDIGVFLLAFLTLSAISKSIAAIVAATFTSLLVGLSLEGVAWLDKEPEMKERLASRWNSLVSAGQARLKSAVLRL